MTARLLSSFCVCSCLTLQELHCKTVVKHLLVLSQLPQPGPTYHHPRGTSPWGGLCSPTLPTLCGLVCPCCALCNCRWDLQQPGLTWERLQENKKQELARLNGVYLKLLDGAGVRYLEGEGHHCGPPYCGGRWQALHGESGWPDEPQSIGCLAQQYPQ